MSRFPRVFLFALVLILATAFSVGAQPVAPRVKVATTTSLYDTGLWDVLEKAFEAESGLELDVIYAGTGRALEWGAAGDVDVVVTHSPTQEAAFLAAGNGQARVPFAYNYFEIVGPAKDPAGLGGHAPEEAFRLLQTQATHKFVSRGDDSGTHTREKAIWKAAGFDAAKIRDSGPWYVEAGLGMGPTLSMASQLEAYTLTDVGTFLAFQSDLDLVPLVTEGEALLNVYAVIVCTKAANPAGAAALAAYLTSDAGQTLIGDFGRAKFGTSLFTPCAGKDCRAAAQK
jgi:tungstate transport system substrate-binding protein